MNSAALPARALRVPDALEAVPYFIASAGLLWFHIALSLVSGLALIWVMPVVLAGVFFLSKRLFLALLLVSILFQNLLLSFHGDLVDGPLTFQILQGTNFLFAALGGALAAGMILTRGQMQARRMAGLALGFILLTALWSAYGAQRSSMISASIYFRFNVTGPLLLLCGLYLGQGTERRFFLHLLTLSAGMLLALGLLEFCFPLEMYSFFNVDNYLSLKFPEKTQLHDVMDLIEATTRQWLNFTGSFGPKIELLRLQGPALHSISFAYFLAFHCLALAYFGLRALPVMLFALLLLVGGKGALIYAFLPFAVWGVYVLTGSVRLCLAALAVLLVAYIGGVLAYGFSTRDLHVLGLSAGVESLLLHPLGHGVGVGGNMSDLARAERDYALFQQEGAPFAIESALGVLLYQMGFAALVLFALVGRLGKHLPPLLLAAMLTLFANSLFQEEAFSPAGWGLLMLFLGFILTAERAHE